MSIHCSKLTLTLLFFLTDKWLSIVIPSLFSAHVITLFSYHCSLTGKLVDITKNYKYMYICCGSVVILASIWLFIGNFINYHLLEKERNAEMYKQAELEEPDKEPSRTEDGQVSENVCEKGEGHVQRESNI